MIEMEVSEFPTSRYKLCISKSAQKYQHFQAPPLCEAGHVMELIKSSENQDWTCDFCERDNISTDVGEKVQAWRCPQDIRNSKGDRKATGCDYDICTRCITEYRVSVFVQSTITCSKSVGCISSLKDFKTEFTEGRSPKINSQSFKLLIEDTQVRYISQKYTLDKYNRKRS